MLPQSIFSIKNLKTTLLLAVAWLAFSSIALAQDPVAVLDNPVYKSSPTKMSAADFVKSKGVALVTEGAYQVAEFAMVIVPKKNDPLEVRMYSGAFDDRAQKLVANAKPGDTFYFENIRAKSPDMTDESEWKKLNSIVVRIE